MEFGTLPERAWLAWLVGPPGAGKSTFAAGPHGFERLVELTAMIGPLVDPLRIRKGVLEANGRLVELIRALEKPEENLEFPAFLIVAGLVSEEALLPIRPDEAVWLIRPDRDRWKEQLRQRPTAGGSSRQYDDTSYSAPWYERFEIWLGRPGLHEITTPFVPELLGKVIG